MSYLEAFHELQSISDRIKNDLIPIEKLPDEIKRARELVSFCENLLRGIESELKEQ